MFTPSELDKALSKLKKSNATGVDEVHNAMLTNLSPPNKKHLLRLFNLMYSILHGNWDSYFFKNPPSGVR
jgi:hypothetical protein